MDNRATGPRPQASGPVVEHALPEGVPNLIGTEVGNYKITRYIGRGGMGAVFVAVNSINKEVAIKILRADLPRQEQRIEREAMAAGSVRQEGIVDILEIGRLSSGQNYIMMEYIEGITLKNEIERQPSAAIPQHRAFHYAYCIARIMVGVHARNYIHRDLKPANIMIINKDLTMDEPLANIVKIFDFGLARAINQSETTSVTFSVTTLEGTAFYMAPEQWDDSSATRQQLTGKVDVYALGCVMYEMLTGVRPFDGANLSEIGAQHRTEIPRSLREFDVTINDDVENLVCRMLAKVPDKRPTMEYVRDLLKSILQSFSQPAPIPRITLNSKNPYVGLRSYTQQDGGIYSLHASYLSSVLEKFGRSGHHWLHINGPQYCGKTSFIHAGLCAAINRRQGNFANASIVYFQRSRKSPLVELASLLIAAVPELGSSPEELAARFEANQDGLQKILNDLHKQYKQRSIVLVIDPLDDIMSLEFAERHKLDCLLAYAVKSSYTPFFLVTALRSECGWRWAELPTLAGLLRSACCLQLPALEADSLLERLQAQAERQGYVLEPELKEALRADILSTAVPLPLINYTLSGIWFRRNEHHLNLEAYQSLGSVDKLIDNSAEALLSTLTESQYSMARIFLTALVKPGRGSNNLLRFLPWEEVQRIIGGSEQTTSIITALSGRSSMEFSSGMGGFGIIALQGTAPEQREVCLAHELLLLYWTRLREWVEEDREVLERWDALEIAALRAQVDTVAPVIAEDLAGYFAGRDLKESQCDHLRQLRSPAAQTFLDAALQHARLREKEEQERQASLRRELQREQKNREEAERKITEVRKRAKERQSSLNEKVEQLSEQLTAAQGNLKQTLSDKRKQERQLTELEADSVKKKHPIRRWTFNFTIMGSLLAVGWLAHQQWISPGQHQRIQRLMAQLQDIPKPNVSQTTLPAQHPAVVQPSAIPPTPVPTVVPPPPSVTPNIPLGMILIAPPTLPKTLAPFLIDRTEVTVAAYESCVANRLCKINTAKYNDNVKPMCNRGPEKANHPMNCVSQLEAKNYCQIMGKRLPTEAEWEFAALGALRTQHPWGNDSKPPEAVCWQHRAGTCEVGTSAGDKSPFGVLDMAGNVQEWTDNPSAGSTQLRTFLGGSWYAGVVRPLGSTAMERYELASDRGALSRPV